MLMPCGLNDIVLTTATQCVSDRCYAAAADDDVDDDDDDDAMAGTSRWRFHSVTLPRSGRCECFALSRLSLSFQVGSFQCLR